MRENAGDREIEAEKKGREGERVRARGRERECLKIFKETQTFDKINNTIIKQACILSSTKKPHRIPLLFTPVVTSSSATPMLISRFHATDFVPHANDLLLFLLTDSQVKKCCLDICPVVF